VHEPFRQANAFDKDMPSPSRARDDLSRAELAGLTDQSVRVITLFASLSLYIRPGLLDARTVGLTDDCQVSRLRGGCGGSLGEPSGLVLLAKLLKRFEMRAMGLEHGSNSL